MNWVTKKLLKIQPQVKNIQHRFIGTRYHAGSTRGLQDHQQQGRPGDNHVVSVQWRKKRWHETDGRGLNLEPERARRTSVSKAFFSANRVVDPWYRLSCAPVLRIRSQSTSPDPDSGIFFLLLILESRKSTVFDIVLSSHEEYHLKVRYWNF